MRLFGVPDGTVDRYDRAAWLTDPFDRAWLNAVGKAPRYALGPVVGWVGPVQRAEGPRVGWRLRTRVGTPATLASTGRVSARGPATGASGRAAGAAAAVVGVTERERLAEGPTGGSF